MVLAVFGIHDDTAALQGLSTPTRLIALHRTPALFFICWAFSEKEGNSASPSSHLCPGKEGARCPGPAQPCAGEWDILVSPAWKVLSVSPGVRPCLLMLAFSPQVSAACAAASSNFEEEPTAGGGQQGGDEVGGAGSGETPLHCTLHQMIRGALGSRD